MADCMVACQYCEEIYCPSPYHQVIYMSCRSVKYIHIYKILKVTDKTELSWILFGDSPLVLMFHDRDEITLFLLQYSNSQH